MKYLDKEGLYYLWTKLKALLNGKSDTGHTHKKSEITDFPTSMTANGGNADTVNGYHIVESSSAPTTNDTSIITIVI